MKRTLFYWAKKNINADNIRLAVLLVPLSVILMRELGRGNFSIEDILDTDILISFVLIVLCDIVAKCIIKYIHRKCEDSAKLTQNYPKLMKQYSAEDLITYKGRKFPVKCEHMRSIGEHWKIEIVDEPESHYELPSQVADLSGEIMEAHAGSDLYNQINIRLQDIEYREEEGVLTLHTGRTFYFDSMLTNRACDYELSNGKTIRSIFEPGPYILPLSLTKMSNHLGFNGFVMTSDGKIPFIMRGDNLSIGKNTLANSIGASLKAAYAIDCHDGYRMNREKLGEAILREIIDELALCQDGRDEEYMHQMSVTAQDAVNSIFAVYRDLVECGKPQFLFYLPLDISSEEMEKGFSAKIARKAQKEARKSKEIKERVIRDGKKMLFFTVDELRDADISAGTIEIVVNGEKRTFAMMPSASASVVMLLQALDSELNE